MVDYEPIASVTVPTVVADSWTTGNVTFDTGSARNCYIPLYPYPAVPTCPPTTIVNWPAYPAMHPHCCPVCEGKETVPAGFYRDVAEDKGPQECRACKGKGIIYLP